MIYSPPTKPFPFSGYISLPSLPSLPSDTCRYSPKYSSFLMDSGKRPREDGETMGSTVPAKFRGILPQQSGHWGAQIYANHQRIWLGTFRTDKEAAMAYDSASIKLRRGESLRNFPMTELTSLEQAFQDNFSEEEIFDMIKDGMYQPKLKDFARNIISEDQRRDMAAASHLDSPASGSHQISCRLLFQKELTPSDVGKLNRLVIPKKYALKHFPSIRETAAGAGGAGYVDDAELVFRDRMMNAWKFRYCYWKSSQSFVFTRGWNRFVKEKELRAKDIITFYTCVYMGGAGAGAAQDEVANTFLLIDVSYFDCANGYNDDDKMMEPSEIKEELELRLGEGCSFRRYDSQGVEGGEEGEAKVEERGLRLFGVQIS